MITVTAFKWVPPFAAGQVRDHRVRWMLNEIGWDYEIDLIDPTVQASERVSGRAALRAGSCPAGDRSSGPVRERRDRARPRGTLGQALAGGSRRAGAGPELGHRGAQFRRAVPLECRRGRFLHRRRNAEAPAPSGRGGGGDATAGQALGRPRRPQVPRGRRVHRGRPHAGLGPAGRGPRRLCSRSIRTFPPIANAVWRGPPSGRRSPTSAATSMPTVPRTWAGIPRCSRNPQQAERRRPKSECKGELKWSRQSISSSRATASRR